MNKIFKVIWSKSKQCYIVVSEMAKNHSGKKKIIVASILAAMAVGGETAVVEVQAGAFDGGQIGSYYATAIGYKANAFTDSSIAIGTYSYSKGTQVPGDAGSTVDPSIAIGNKARAVGNSALAVGMNATADNSFGVAVGRNTEVTGDYGVGIGFKSKAALHGIGIGEQARALKEGATTLGVSSRGYGKGAIAIGWQSLAGADVYTAGVPGNDINKDSSSKIDGYNNWGDMSVGLRALATGGNATALGRNAAATAANAVAIGGGNGNSFNDNTERTLASGEKSAAIGYNSAASGTSASALGTKASASAENAAAIGTSASASAKDTLAAGSSALATAEGATAVGKAAKAQKSDATAVGSGAQATEVNAVAVGKGTKASAADAFAAGTGAEASEANATALGNGATAEKANAIAIGKGATAGGGVSGVAIGKGAQSQAEEATAIGADSKAKNAHDSALGTSATASGGGSTAVGYLVNATGNQSFSAGSNTKASGEASVGIGYKASATGNRAISIGGNNGNNVNQATGANSTAIGTGAQSTAGNATALGKGAIAKASDAMAFGTDAVAGNSNATALGNGANAISTSGIAIGEGATVGVAAAGGTPAVDAANSIAIGKNAKVLAGSGSIALGADTQITSADVATSNKASQKTYPYMLTDPKGPDAVADKENGIVAIGTKRSSTGDTGFARRLTGVAGGVGDYDAVNLKQAKAIESSLKKGERHIKATSYSPNTAGTITLNYVDGENKDVSNETATITDVAKKSVVDGINTTVNTHTTQISNLTTAVGGKVSQSDFDTFKAKAITFKGDDNAGVARTLDTTLTVKGGANYTPTTTTNTNIRVEKDGASGLLVKLSEKLAGIKEIAGDGKTDLVIKNGTNTVTIKPGKDNDKGTINFGDAKVVASNLEADITYRANGVADTAANTVKLKKGLNFTAATDTTTTTDGPKSGVSITTGADGLVTFGLDKVTRNKVDNVADKNLSNLSDDGKNKVKELAKTAAQDAVKVAPGINTTMDTDTTTTPGVTTYKVNAIDTTVAVGSDALTINDATPNANKVRAYSVDLSTATKGKLAAVGNLATVIGGTTIAADGTVTGPTFNITNAAGGTDSATTLKDAIDKLNATNAGHNTKISETAGKVGTLETNVTNLGNTVTNLGNTVTNLGNTVTNNYNDLSNKITQAGANVASTLTSKGLDFTGNDATETGKVHRDLGTTLTIQGAENFTRGTTDNNNIKVSKNGNTLDVKLAENLGNIKEIAGDGKTDLVIKNGDTKVTVKAPKDGDKGSIDFGDTKLVTNNLDANISYKAGTETDKKTVKLQTGLNFVAGDGTVAPAAPAAGTVTTTPAAGTTTSPTASTDGKAAKKGIVISTEADGVVNIGLDSDTRSAIDNAANKDLSNLTQAGSNKVSELAKAAAKEAVKVDNGINTTVDTDTTTTPGVTTYKVNAIDTTVAVGSDALTINDATPNANKVRAYSVDLSTATKGKLAAVGNLATVIGGTTIAADGTVTGPTFNITKADGGTDSVTTLKDAIDKLNATNAGQNTKISETAGKVGTLETNVTNLGNTVTNLGNTVTNLGNTVTNNYNDLSNKITQAGANVASTLTSKGLDFTGNDATETGKVHRDLGTTLTIQGAENFTRGTTDNNNIKVSKNGNTLDVKLAENLGNIKEIAGDGTHDLVIKNGDTKVTVKAPKDGNTGSIDFGNTKLVTNNLEADIAYKAGGESSKKTVKLQTGLNFVAGIGTVATTTPAAGTATTTSPTASTDDKATKKGIVISTEADGVVNIGLDSDTRSAIDNAASKNYVENALTNLNSTITGNANLNFAGNVTKDAQDKDADKVGLPLATGTLYIKGDATDITTTAKGDTVTIALTSAAQGKLAAVGNLATVIGGTTIAADGTVTGPTFNITKAEGGTEKVNTLKEAIEKLDAANAGQNTKISETAGKVGTLETNVTNLGNTVTNLGNTVTNLGNTVTNNYNDLSNKITQAGANVASTLTSKGLDFTGNDATETGKVHRDLGTTLTIQGAENFTRGTTDNNNIKVSKNGNTLDVKLAENLVNIKEISGNGTDDLVIKNGDTKVTIKAPKDGDKGSIDFGDTKLVTNNLDADITYRANGVADTAAHKVKLQKGLNFVAGDGTVAPAAPAAGTVTTTPAAGTTTSPTASTDGKAAKKGIVISTEADGVVNIGLDSDTRSAIDNAASKSEVNTAITNLSTTITNNSNLRYAGDTNVGAAAGEDHLSLALATGTLKVAGTTGEVKTVAQAGTITISLEQAVKDKLDQLSAKNADGRDGKLGSEANAIAFKGIAKADGLNGTTATYKVNALRHGEAGTVVYTDQAGNRIVKATDGKYYKATEVNADGVVKTPAENNGVAPVEVLDADIVATLVNKDGTTEPAATDADKVATTKLTNIKEAAITATSNDAVTGRQLYGLKSDLATYLGGDSKVNADGTFTGPTYNITKDDGSNTTEGAKNVGAAISKLDTRINNANSTLSTKGLDFYGNKDGADTDKVHRNLGEALKVKGADNFTRTGTNNIDVVKNTAGDGLDIKLAENLGNMKGISGNGTDSLVIKNGDATITLTPAKPAVTDPTSGNVTKPAELATVNFGDSNVVVKNLDADITYRANNDTDANAKSVKLKKGLNFVAGTGTVAQPAASTTPATGGTTTPATPPATDSETTKSGIVITADTDGKVTIGLDTTTRSAIDNAANKDLSNLSQTGKDQVTALAKAAAKDVVKVEAGKNTTVTPKQDGDVTKYVVDAYDTKVAVSGTELTINGGDPDANNVRTYTLGLSDDVKNKLTAVTNVGNTASDGRDGKAANGKDGAAGNAGDKGLTGKDGLNGSTLTDKVNALRNGEAGSVVYTNEAGERLIKANDGNYYKPSEVNTDGSVKTQAENNNVPPTPVANPQARIVNGSGDTTTPTTLSNIADGKIADGSHDAVNGGQLNTVKTDLTKAGLDFTGDDTTDKVHRDLGTTLTIKGGANFTRGTTDNNIKVVKNNDALDVKLAENLVNMKEISGDGKTDLVIKNGDATITLTPAKPAVTDPTAGTTTPAKTATVDFGDSNVVVKNLDADITYRANNAKDTDAKTVKLKKGLNFVSATDAITTTDGPKSGLTITTGDDGLVTFGLDKDTRKAIDNAANQDLSNLTTAGKKVITDAAQGAVKVKAGNNVTIDPETEDNVTTYTVNGRDTTVQAAAGGSVSVTGGTLSGAGERAYTVDLTEATKTQINRIDGIDTRLGTAEGNITTLQQAVQGGRVFAADTGVASAKVALGGTLAIKGGAKDILKADNIGVELTDVKTENGVTTPATMMIRLAKNVDMKDGSTSYDYYKDIKGTSVKVVTTKVDGSGVTITPEKVLDKLPVTLTVDGLDNGGNPIHNVGAGTKPNDAATVGQVNAVAGAVSQRVNNIGAHAAALAAMNPLSYDPLKKSQVMAGYGAYKGSNALALGVAHYANEDTLFNVGVSVGNGENMVNAGVTYRFGGEDSMIPERYKGGPISSVYVMQDEITALKAENARKDVENAKKEAENEEMKAQIKMLIERVTMLEAKK